MTERPRETEYPTCLNLNALPATHNHVIGPVQPMSLDNIRGVLAVVHRLLQANDGRAVAFGDDEVAGLSCILDNAFHALRFEQYYRGHGGE